MFSCPSPTNSVFLNEMEAYYVTPPVTQQRISSFLPSQYSATPTPPVSPAFFPSVFTPMQNYGTVMSPYSNFDVPSSSDQSPCQFPPTPTNSETSMENTSAETIGNTGYGSERNPNMQPQHSARDDRSTSGNSESFYPPKGFAHWFNKMVTDSKELENFKYNLARTIGWLKKGQENTEEIAKEIVSGFQRKLNTTEGYASYARAKVAYNQILIVDKILRDRDLKTEYSKLFEKFEIMKVFDFDKVSHSLSDSSNKQANLLKIRKYWDQVFSNDDKRNKKRGEENYHPDPRMKKLTPAVPNNRTNNLLIVRPIRRNDHLLLVPPNDRMDVAPTDALTKRTNNLSADPPVELTNNFLNSPPVELANNFLHDPPVVLANNFLHDPPVDLANNKSPNIPLSPNEVANKPTLEEMHEGWDQPPFQYSTKMLDQEPNVTEMIMEMEPLEPLQFPFVESNEKWEEENLRHRIPLKNTEDLSFDEKELVDNMYHYFVELKSNVTFRRVDNGHSSFLQIWHSANNSTRS